VKPESWEFETLDPYQEYRTVDKFRVVKEMVAQIVDNYRGSGWKVCTRSHRIIPDHQCYSVATMPENNRTLFLIPKNMYQENRRESQSNEARESTDPERMQTALPMDIEEHDSVQPAAPVEQNEQRQSDEAPESEHQAIETESLGVQTMEDGENTPHVNVENQTNNERNADNVESTKLLLKIIQRDSHHVSKPANELKWELLESMDVPHGDPDKTVAQKMRRLWETEHLKAHNKNMFIIDPDSCYEVARKADDRTLYLTGPQAQTHTSSKKSEFVPPLPSKQEVQPPEARENPPMPPPSAQQWRLASSDPDEHRDKIGKGRKNNIGMTYKQETTTIRKTPDGMRIMQQPEDNMEVDDIQQRKLSKPRQQKDRPYWENIE
jgi:hypothetical protein